MGKKNDNTLVKNASFLMIAALISKIIGLIYKSPLSSTMGKESFGCFQFAQNVYLHPLVFLRLCQKSWQKDLRLRDIEMLREFLKERCFMR